MPLRARSRTACEIARIDPDRLNEYIKAGALSCAPETRAGSARIFDQDEIVMLCIFGQLLAMRMNSEKAGQIACECLYEFRNKPDVAFVTYARTPSGSETTVVGFIGEETTVKPASYIPMRFIFDIASMRQAVQQHLEYERENAVVGD